MKKKITSALTHPIFLLLFGLTFVLPFAVVFATNTNTFNFTLYFKMVGVVLLFDLCMIVLPLITSAIMLVIVKMINKIEEKKENRILKQQHDDIIENFHLNVNEYTEVDAVHPDNENNKKALLNIINEYNGKTTYLTVKILDNVHSLPLEDFVSELPIDFFVNILKKEGFKFYLYVNDNAEKDIVLSFKNENFSKDLLINPDLYSKILKNWTII